LHDLSLPLAFGEHSITERIGGIISGRKWGKVARLSARLHAHLDQISKEQGASAAEYALFLAAIAAVIAAAVQTIGISLNSIFTNFVGAI